MGKKQNQEQFSSCWIMPEIIKTIILFNLSCDTGGIIRYGSIHCSIVISLWVI